MRARYHPGSLIKGTMVNEKMCLMDMFGVSIIQIQLGENGAEFAWGSIELGPARQQV